MQRSKSPPPPTQQPAFIFEKKKKKKIPPGRTPYFHREYKTLPVRGKKTEPKNIQKNKKPPPPEQPTGFFCDKKTTRINPRARIACNHPTTSVAVPPPFIKKSIPE